jgi:hypothetical protein
MRTVTVQINDNDDANTIDGLLRRHNLHPLSERLQPRMPNKLQRIVFNFATVDEGASAYAVLTAFLPPD